jgi:hypothetical protein
MTSRDPLDRFEERARRARDDGPEPLDVSRSVRARLPGPAPQTVSWVQRWDLPPGLLAAAAVALAVTGVASALAVPWVDPLLDPMLGLLDLPVGDLP